MDSKAWLEELPADARDVLEAGRAVDAPAGTERAVWRQLAAKLPPAASATAATTSGVTALSLLKTFAVGLALGAAAVSGVAVVRHVTEPATTPPPAALSPSASLARPPAPANEPVAPRTTAPAIGPSSAPPPAAPGLLLQPPAATPDGTGDAPAVPSPRPSIATFPAEPSTPQVEAGTGVLVESQRLAHARSLLQSGNAKGAVAALDALERAFPHGVLVQEREALRIEALLVTGERARARREAERFLARYPKSPHAAAAERALR